MHDTVFAGLFALILFVLLYRIGSEIGSFRAHAVPNLDAVQTSRAPGSSYAFFKGNGVSIGDQWINPAVVSHFEIATHEGGTNIHFIGGQTVMVGQNPQEVGNLLKL